MNFYGNSRNEAQSKNSWREKELGMKFKSEGGLLTGYRASTYLQGHGLWEMRT